jgi:hypothetical protein
MTQTQTQMWFGRKIQDGTMRFIPSGRGYDVAVFRYKARRGAHDVVFLNMYDAIGRVPSLQRVRVETASRRSLARSTTRGGK